MEFTDSNIYLFKVNNRNVRKRCEICSKLTTKTLCWVWKSKCLVDTTKNYFKSYFASYSDHFWKIIVQVLKSCVRYFLFFHQIIALQKLCKMFFNSSKKLFSFSRYSNFSNFFSSFPHFPDSREQIEVE